MLNCYVDAIFSTLCVQTKKQSSDYASGTYTANKSFAGKKT